ncbi:MAG: hypothetical protein ACOYMN_12335 [Roseimicrobium sp.]
MIKRPRRASDEIMLIPFLDILCSLIGVLILIIVVLCVAQSQQTNARTPQELERAQKYQELLKQQKELLKLDTTLEQKLAKLEELRKQVEEKEQRLAKLRKLLASSADIRKMSQELSQNLVKELDNLLLEIEGLDKQEVALKKELAALMEEMKARQAPKQKVLPPVVVRPGGSGLAQGTRLFFVEATGGRITIYWDQKAKTTVSATAEVIAADASYNHYLKEVLKVPQAKIIFLMRDDGSGAFNNAAGWAQATYNYRVDQIGKLPIPGRGEIDLQMFKDYLGTITPPPEAKLVPPPPQPPAKPAAAQPPAKA